VRPVNQNAQASVFNSCIKCRDWQGNDPWVANSRCNGLRQYICNYLMTTLRVRPEWREKKKKSERSCKTRSVLYLEILGLCADIEQDRTG
jgi:hypothetical protein